MASYLEIERELRRRIEAGDWQDKRVPPERHLADEFSAARNTVRRALDRLVEEGLLNRQVGRGTFVRPRNTPLNDSFLARLRDASPSDLMEVRLVIEPQVAALAASRADARDLSEIDAALKHSIAAKGTAEFEHWDARLHMTIFRAARNDILIEYCGALNAVRSQPKWYRLKQRTLTPELRLIYDKQHSAIVAALAERDGDSAGKILRKHLTTVRDHLLATSD